MWLFLRIWEDVVGAFLYPGLVLQSVHLLNIDNVPHLFGLRRSSSSTKVDPDPSNLHAELSASFTDCCLRCLSNPKYRIHEETGVNINIYFSHLIVNDSLRDYPNINVVLPVVDNTNHWHLARFTGNYLQY